MSIKLKNLIERDFLKAELNAPTWKPLPQSERKRLLSETQEENPEQCNLVTDGGDSFVVTIYRVKRMGAGQASAV